jgi:hypothetical protein
MMALLEDRTAVFIVRVWCERGDGDAAVTEWRGSVEHIQSGQRAFFRNLEAVLEFVRPHLEGIGIDAQQRFWERISSALEDDAPPAVPVAIPIPPADAATPHDPPTPSFAVPQARSPS